LDLAVYQCHHHREGWPDLALKGFLDFLVARLRLAPQDLVTLVFADDAFVRPLNATYRGKDKVTNVLSFASDAEDELGDLIFALGTIEAEAADLQKPFEVHMRHLILHGSLHLLGYDHETPGEALEMESLETQILAEFGDPDPYAESS